MKINQETVQGPYWAAYNPKEARFYQFPMQLVSYTLDLPAMTGDICKASKYESADTAKFVIKRWKLCSIAIPVQITGNLIWSYNIV